MNYTMSLQNDPMETIIETTDLLHASFNCVNQFQLLINLQFNVIAYNAFADQFSNKYLDKQLIKGMPVSSLVNDCFSEELNSLCSKAVNGEVVKYEHFITNKQQENCWLEFTINPLFNSSFNIVGLLITGNNINRQKKAEQMVRHQSQTLSAIAQLQSHQVRQPISSLLGIINLIKEDVSVPGEYVQNLEKATRQLDDIIKAIVNQSRKDFN